MIWRHRMALALVRAAQGKTFTDFMTAMEGKKVKNPDTDRMVLYKSLKGPKGQQLLKDEYGRWKAKYHGGDEGEAESEPGGEDEKTKKAPKSKPFKPLDLSTYESQEAYAKSWDKTREKWPEDQKNALKKYTGDDYLSINSGLRKGTPTEPTKALVAKMDKLFKSSKGKTKEDVTVFRKVGSNHPLVQLLSDGELKEGYTYEDPGYMSTSIREGAFDSGGQGIFHIDVPKGTQGVYVGEPPEGEYSNFSDEMELVLNRGTKVEITKIDGINIYCKVVSQ